GDVVAYLAHEPDAAVRGDVRIARPAPLPGHVPLLHLDRLALGDQAVRHADPEHGGEYQRGGCPHESSSMCRGEAGSAPAHHAPPRLPRAGGSSRPARPPGDPGLEWRSVLSYDTRARGNVEGGPARRAPSRGRVRRPRPDRRAARNIRRARVLTTPESRPLSFISSRGADHVQSVRLARSVIPARRMRRCPPGRYRWRIGAEPGGGARRGRRDRRRRAPCPDQYV